MYRHVSSIIFHYVRGKIVLKSYWVPCYGLQDTAGLKYIVVSALVHHEVRVRSFSQTDLVV